MEEKKAKRVRKKRSGYKKGEDDMLTNLPVALLHQILLNLPTKDVVKSSVLSRRWKNIWKYVPGLDLECRDFFVPGYQYCECGDYDDIYEWDGYDNICECEDLSFKAFAGFVTRFLRFKSKSRIQNFSFSVNWCADVELDVDFFTWLINAVIKRKVKHLDLVGKTWGQDEVEIPRTVYTCESLVSLNLRDVDLPNPERVSLPSLKVMVLDEVVYSDDRAFEMLISGCPVLESLSITVDYFYGNNVKTFRVCSQSLLSFTYVGHDLFGSFRKLAAVLDAPRLERLRIDDHRTSSFIVKNLGSLVEADIDIAFNLSSERKLDADDLPKREMIRNFLVGISCVKDMKISSNTLQVIYDYSRYEPLPLFRNLSFLHVQFSGYRWKMLPVFLESCLNLKSLILGFFFKPWEKGACSIVPGHRRFLSSLEYVKIVRPMGEEATETHLKLKLTLCLSDFFEEKEETAIIKKLLAIPRLSSSCEVHIL
ncbi:hypothetical protein EUTSA_v10007510mg [Eutrema salsugineum]|uniref:F-box domain-containing protein n=1 Tax=Eutrema salsugineum TaxID=72664 RepID=V4KV30_EUTSA|nr:hypothetical protein EUTSA_v10007510mg [Eutrema salsugineum]